MIIKWVLIGWILTSAGATSVHAEFDDKPSCDAAMREIGIPLSKLWVNYHIDCFPTRTEEKK